MLRPISARPPSGVTRSVPGARAGGSKTSVPGMCSLLRLARGARDLRQRATGGGVAVGAEVREIESGDIADQGDLVFDEGGLGFLRADERQSHPRAGDAPEPVQDVLGRDG